jgi:hypothetical protein
MIQVRGNHLTRARDAERARYDAAASLSNNSSDTLRLGDARCERLMFNTCVRCQHDRENGKLTSEVDINGAVNAFRVQLRILDTVIVEYGYSLEDLLWPLDDEVGL